MKLKLTPTHISLLGLGVFATVVAKELTRSEAKTPSATPNDLKSKRTTNSAALPNSAIALSQPESLVSSTTLPSVSRAEIKPSSKTPPKVPNSTSLPAVPKVQQDQPAKTQVAQTQLRVVDVNQLPIDAVVQETLNLANAAPPPPPPPITTPTASKDIEPTPTEATPTKNASPEDIQGHRAQASITALMKQGIMQGYTDGTFRPNAKITDEQFQSVVNQAAGRSKSLVSLRRPPDIVTRGDAATFVYRQLQRTTETATPTIATASAPLPKLASASVAEVAQTPPPPIVPTFKFATSNQSTPAAADSYRLEAGDRVRVDVFNVPEYSKEYTVLGNGTLNLHRAGNLSVAGLSMRQAQNAIATKYARLLKSPVIDLSLLAARPVNVAIAGEVSKPGTYALNFTDGKFPTVTKLIREAGGIKQLANLKEVKVSRTTPTGAPQTISVDLWQLLKSGDLNQDLVLQQGDTVTIPTARALSSEEARQRGDASFAPSAVKATIVGK